MSELESLRTDIDRIDEELIRLLNERTRVALEIGRVKKETGGEIYRPDREKAVFDHIEEVNPGPMSGQSLRSIYREVMSAALALEHDLKIAYLGPPATFTHQAARERFGGSVAYVPRETIADVFTAIDRNAADYGVVPIENSTDGAVTHTLDQFMDTACRICAEIYLPIAHHLMAAGDKDSIRRVYSKPEVFGQCRRWLQDNLPGVDLVPVSSTARGAEMAAGEAGAAALASFPAAELYGLRILADNIQDLSGNTTRFLVIGRTGGEPTGEDKTSIMFAVRHQAGALYEALGVIKQAGLNMTKIESRPSKTKAWEYSFFVDFEGHVADAAVEDALRDLDPHCTMLTVLGSYPRAGVEAPHGLGGAR